MLQARLEEINFSDGGRFLNPSGVRGASHGETTNDWNYETNTINIP